MCIRDRPYSPYMSLRSINFNDYAYYDGTWIKSVHPSSKDVYKRQGYRYGSREFKKIVYVDSSRTI